MAVEGTATASWLNQLSRYSDAILAGVIGMVVIMLMVPLPTSLLDVMLIINLILCITVLLVTMYNSEPLEFSVFPTLLLVATLFRLALYIAAARLILSQGQAGAVVDAFGSIIIAGNYVVGIIIFIILVIVQFVVITNGTSRISEVAARFTLDAMPGKQMAIDADLNSGLITEEQARDRRRTIERESDFYGAMDGASKFVRGDAIAGIIITVVNMIGGFAIGALQFDMDLFESLETFGRLAIGAGLSIQIPALLISTAAGIIVTRVASEVDLGQEMSIQLLTKPRAVAIAAVLIALFGLIPGLPKLPFFALAGLAGLAAYLVGKSTKAAELAEEARLREEEEAQTPESMIEMLQVDPMELEVGYGLIPLVDPEQGGEILDRITLMRRQTALELGYVVPPIRIRDNIQLESNDYIIKLKGSEIAKGQVLPDRHLAIGTGMAQEEPPGVKTVEPAFGLPAFWITEEEKERTELLGFTVVDAASAIITHLSEVIKKYSHEMLSRQDVQTLLDSVKQTNPVVVDELVPNIMTVGEIQHVLKNLLRERVSIRDIVTILESLGNQAPATKNIDILTEHIRQALGRHICRQHQTPESKLEVVTLDPNTEREIVESVDYTEQAINISMAPEKIQEFIDQVSASLEKVVSQGKPPIMLCSANVRLPVRRLTERALPNLVVLSYNEVAPETEVESVGMVSAG